MSERYGLRAFAAANALALEQHECYGTYRGFPIHVRYRALGNPACLVTVVTDTKGKDRAIENFLEKNKRELGISNFGVVGIGLMVCPRLRGGGFRKLEAMLETITAKLAKLGCLGADACPYCGRPLGETAVAMRESDVPFRAHEACFAAARRSMAERERREEERPDKKAAGVCGMLFGTLVGVAVLVLTFLWWGFGALGLPAAMLLGGYLYTKFGGKESAFKVALCSAVPILLLTFVYCLCLYLEASADLGGYASAFARIAADWKDAGYRAAVIVNFACLAAFAAASVVWLVHCRRRARRKFAADRLVRRA